MRDPAAHVSRSGERLSVGGATTDELKRLAHGEALALTPDELRAIAQRIGRDPTRAEAHAFAIQWSEHCSYKSSRPLLRALPTKSADVLVGVGEDAGILRAGAIDGVEYGVVVAHESHNHPSQVVPFEGAATGVGGILRDVLCMGAEVVASADPLRFGLPEPGSHQAYVAAAAVDGIGSYGNAVGVPNLAGDVYFHDSFAQNCLVNVVALGIVRADRIIRSRVPPEGADYDLVLVGKATDASGFGGAAFASLVLDASLAQANKSAVQVPDPFLKSVIMRASYAVFEEVHRLGLSVGFKDLGAGGIMGSTCELANAGGFGAAIDLDAVPVAMPGLPPFVIACAETQERMLWAVPSSFTPSLLQIYNERFTLPEVSANARAAVIGTVTAKRQYVVKAAGEAVIDVPIDVLAGAITAERSAAPAHIPSNGNAAAVPSDSVAPERAIDYGSRLLEVLAHRDVCSRRPLIEHYDRFVRGATVIPAGYADAGVFIVKRGARLGIALSVDGNPRYGAVSAREAAAHAVVEAARNVAAVGAQPIGLTDCLNYGNPEDPQAYRLLVEGVAGLAEAARALQLNKPGEPLPFVSGNVSLYNESAAGKAIVPSAVVACLGRVDDVSAIVTMRFTAEGNPVYLFGARTAALGGSVINALERRSGGQLPPLDYNEANASIKAVVAAIHARAVSAAHDISDGGLLACVAEMCLGGDADGRIGVVIRKPGQWAPSTPLEAALFGETPGFVVEVPANCTQEFESICRDNAAHIIKLGETGGTSIRVEGVAVDVPLISAAKAWSSPLGALYA
ncbi:MAG: phosphoribosylformylglycinamidine synthase subunit PurL [Candidatus Eremiobacteraeota bacterium]|nr:phosphoribosylformylglycinamidine synthase subunit PurL [Candidatus Eremiobacteraeota bacterium]